MIKTPAGGKPSDLLPKLALAILSPLVFLGLLEGGAYLWERGQANGLYAWELVASRRMVWESHPEPGDGYTLMKPLSHYQWQGIAVDINSHGLRGPETPVDKPAGVFRILNLGDSVAMGWGVREEETYGQRLEAALNEHSPSGLRYEVINAGVPGWSLENELAYLQAEGLAYQPDLILLDITLANDINGKSALLAEDRPPVLKWLSANTYFWPFLTSQLAWIKARAQGRDRVDTIDPPTNPAKYFPLDPQAERWNDRWTTISTIAQLGRDHQAPVMMLLFPLEFQVLDSTYTTLPQDIFGERAAAAGIPLLNLLPIFQQACREKPGGPCQLEDRYLFADVWMHPSALGHQLTTEALEPMLTSLP